MGELSSYRVMFDENNKAVIFLGNLPGFDSNKCVWEQIERRKKEMEQQIQKKLKVPISIQFKSSPLKISNNQFEINPSLSNKEEKEQPGEYKQDNKILQDGIDEHQLKAIEPSGIVAAFSAVASPLNVSQSQSSLSSKISQQQSSAEIDWDQQMMEFDGNASLGGGYESVRWQPPEYQGLPSNWDQYII
ncbi:MAG: hypothetical protein EZS28_045114, partial [Streblomastix strix]